MNTCRGWYFSYFESIYRTLAQDDISRTVTQFIERGSMLRCIVLYKFYCTSVHVDTFRTVQMFTVHASTLAHVLLYQCFTVPVSTMTSVTLYKFTVHISTSTRVTLYKFVLYWVLVDGCRIVKFLIVHVSMLTHVWNDTKFLWVHKSKLTRIGLYKSSLDMSQYGSIHFFRCTAAWVIGFAISSNVFRTSAWKPCTVRTVYILSKASGNMCWNTY